MVVEKSVEKDYIPHYLPGMDKKLEEIAKRNGITKAEIEEIALQEFMIQSNTDQDYIIQHHQS